MSHHHLEHIDSFLTWIWLRLLCSKVQDSLWQWECSPHQSRYFTIKSLFFKSSRACLVLTNSEFLRMFLGKGINSEVGLDKLKIIIYFSTTLCLIGQISKSWILVWCPSLRRESYSITLVEWVFRKIYQLLNENQWNYWQCHWQQNIIDPFTWKADMLVVQWQKCVVVYWH